MQWLKKTLLATVAALAACATNLDVGGAPTAPAPRPEAVRTALESGDLDGLIQAARARLAAGDESSGAVAVAALAAFVDGNFQEAAQLGTRLPDARDGFSAYLGAFTAAALGDVEKGTFLLEDARSLSPEQRDRALALLHEVGGRPEKARELLLRLERTLPPPPPRDSDAEATVENVTARLRAWRSAELLFRRGVLEQRAGDRAAATQAFRSVLLYTPHDLETLDALDRLGGGEPPARAALDARQAFSRVLMELADSAGATDFIVASLAQNPELLQQLRLDEVLRLFALRADPGALDLRLMVAGDLAARRKYDAQLRVLNGSRNWGTYAKTVAAQRAEALRRLGRNSEALATLHTAQAGPLRLEEAFALAQEFNLLDRFNDGLALLDDNNLALSGADDRVELLSLRASIHRRAGDFEKAIADLRTASKLSDRRDARSFLAAVLSEFSPTWSEGIELHRRLLADREDASSLNALAWGLLQNPTDTLSEAHTLVVRSLALAPNNYAAIDTLAWSYYLHGDFTSARREAARALSLAKGDAPAEIYDHLGDIYWRLNRQDDARAAWKDALKAYPDQVQKPLIEIKLREGLSTPAPKAIEPPVVKNPLAPPQPKTDI